MLSKGTLVPVWNLLAFRNPKCGLFPSVRSDAAARGIPSRILVRTFSQVTAEHQWLEPRSKETIFGVARAFSMLLLTTCAFAPDMVKNLACSSALNARLIVGVDRETIFVLSKSSVIVKSHLLPPVGKSCAVNTNNSMV